jgi:pimeloyl-ACP methyl ester carboxylesterase
MLKSILIIALVCYGGLLALLYFTQRAMQYFPERLRTAPAMAGLPEAQEIELDTPDGERVIAWHVPPRGDQPVILYFHGNGGSLRGRVERFRALTADGSGLVALSYRGYGGSSGRPSESGLLADAGAAYAFALARYPADRIVLWGESLGTGVAVALAADKPVARVILESPFTAAVDIAARRCWFVPVRWLMKDQFRSDLRVGKVAAPVLVLHGEGTRRADRFGRAAIRADQCAKRFVRFPGAGHNDLGANGQLRPRRRFSRDRPEGAIPPTAVGCMVRRLARR